MNNGSSGNASSTGTTPGNAAPNTHNLSEAEYIQQRAEEAQKALSRTAKLLGENLTRSINPAAWTEQHPWIMVGSAAAAGFLATFLIPSKEQREEKRIIRRLAAIERAVAPRPVVSGQKHDEDNPAKNGIFKGFLNEALKAVRPAIMSAITAGISAKAVTDDEKDKQPAPEPPAEPAVTVVTTPTVAADATVPPPT
jgi:hypothetical protein